MFVPVGCTSCGKLFQVPEAALGQTAQCPWCQAAQPGAPPSPAAGPAEPPAPKWLKKYTGEAPPVSPAAATKPHEQEPLSLDDDEAPAAPPDPRAPRFRLTTVAAVAGLSLAALLLTVAARGYGSGRVQEWFWSEYTPPDRSCSVLLPATPSEQPVDTNPDGFATGGKRYVAKGWLTRSAAWLAWNDLDPAFAKSAAADKGGRVASHALHAEVVREAARLHGTVTKEGDIQAGSGWGYEVHMDTPRGKVIEWLVVRPSGPRPRLYVYGLEATNISPDSAAVRRMFTSFQTHE
ncbi:hypothetical protein R5W23_003326 [Gemmata sp. JC673]|uniref:DUF1795 domain-containing protein n=1 Tax=Gemmata algarum TaxID=2975278 RepID=A0ABU5F518_9BACT|nr:hypothetical protein [Gemmata algarum]MDY3561897.1 hypothetical protein [Gemmata algarum]